MKRKKRTAAVLIFCCIMLFTIMGCSSSSSLEPTAEEPVIEKPIPEEPPAYVDDGLPIVVPESEQIPYVYTTMTYDRLNNITGGNEEGLTLDLGDKELWGKIFISQYPFEAGDAGYDYTFFIDKSGTLTDGTGIIPIAQLLKTKYDANNWLDGGISPATFTAAYQLDLFQGEDTYFGTYGSVVSFNMDGSGMFQKLPTIVDGPYVTAITSDDPTSMEIVWETDEPCSGEVRLGTDVYSEGNNPVKKHVVKISGLLPDTEYEYLVRSSAADGRETVSNNYMTRTAPAKGQGPVVFAFASDSRSAPGGGGGGERDYMGVNSYILNKITASAHKKGADFFIFGGDLVWGMTTSKEDLVLEFKGWKQGMSAFWRSRPVYAGMGNHEVVWSLYDNFSAMLDTWPYDTDSGEAVFASEMYNPVNGPVPSDPRRPSYDENVYSFQYGPVYIISFNNTYWLGNEVYGGSPWGYIMEDQLKWIEDTITAAENDATVKYVFLFGHSPVFPSMKHVNGSMFQGGDNNVRASVKNPSTGEVEPEALGIIEVRNRLWKAVSGSSKVAAVFTGDEHAYHRTLISSTTPVGVYPGDDTDGDGVLDKYSPNPEFTHPVWHITCGGGGAPYAAGLESDIVPWKPERETSEYGYALIRANGDKASMEFIASPVNGEGDIQDKVDDLMAIKN